MPPVFFIGSENMLPASPLEIARSHILDFETFPKNHTVANQTTQAPNATALQVGLSEATQQ